MELKRKAISVLPRIYQKERCERNDNNVGHLPTEAKFQRLFLSNINRCLDAQFWIAEGNSSKSVAYHKLIQITYTSFIGTHESK